MVTGIRLRDLNIRWLGKLPYSEAYDLQLGLHRSVSQEDSKDDYLLLLEHNNVITSGRSSKENNLLVSKAQLNELGIEYFETDRGGDITYHGDGQLIGYPIIRLSDPKKVIPFVRNIENVIIDSLRKFKIDLKSIKTLQDIIINLQSERKISICITDHQAADLLRVCDTAIVLAEGKVIAKGTPYELVKNEIAINAYFGDSFKFN